MVMLIQFTTHDLNCEQETLRQKTTCGEERVYPKLGRFFRDAPPGFAHERRATSKSLLSSFLQPNIVLQSHEDIDLLEQQHSLLQVVHLNHPKENGKPLALTTWS